MIWIFAAAALAQSPAHYAPDSIAQSSQLFRSYAEGLAPKFEALQNSLGRAGRGLEELEQSVLLLGDRAPEEMLAYLEQSRRTANHAFLVAQEHVSLIEADSQGVFEGAMGRAISEVAEERELVECSQPSGMMAFGPSRGQTNCEGDDLNADIAARMDADPALQQAVQSILSVDWPQVDFTPKTLPSVPLSDEDTQGFVQVGALSQVFLSDALAEIEANLERRLAPIQAKLQSGDEAGKEEAIREAEEHRAAFNAEVAELGNRLFSAMEAGLKKQTIALCPNPPVFGGCPGEDQTAAIVESLQGSRRFQRAVDW